MVQLGETCFWAFAERVIELYKRAIAALEDAKTATGVRSGDFESADAGLCRQTGSLGCNRESPGRALRQVQPLQASHLKQAQCGGCQSRACGQTSCHVCRSKCRSCSRSTPQAVPLIHQPPLPWLWRASNWFMLTDHCHVPRFFGSGHNSLSSQSPLIADMAIYTESWTAQNIPHRTSSFAIDNTEFESAFSGLACEIVLMV